MKYLSLFSGIGGFEVGIKNAAPDWSCVGYSEINKPAIKVYSEHFPEHSNFGDITKLNISNLPDFDVLVGGFPCQAFSVAGLRKGFDDIESGGNLVFEIFKILQVKKPKCVFLENVKGLVSHNNGHSFWLIKKVLARLGYKVFTKVLNSADYGVPHRRERVYFVCFRDDLNIEHFDFPVKEPLYKSFKDLLEEIPPKEVYLTPDQMRKILGIGSPINAHGGYISENPVYNCITASYAVAGGNSMKFYRNGEISALSPVECERLQAFPDNWTSCLPTSQRYKTLGNAVTTVVIEKIIKEIVRSFDKS